MLVVQEAKDPRKLRFPLQSIESTGFNEVVLIDHHKICMTATGYNQVLVMIDHFTKYAEAAPCMTASAEETCDHFRMFHETCVNEKVAGGTGPLDHLSPTNKWPSREAKSSAGIHVESLLLTLH